MQGIRPRRTAVPIHHPRQSRARDRTDGRQRWYNPPRHAAGTGRRLFPFFIPRRDGAPAQQQSTGLEHILLGQLELDGKISHRHTAVAIDGSKHAIGTRDIGRIHATDGSIPTQQQRGHAKLGADATRRVVGLHQKRTQSHGHRRHAPPKSGRPRAKTRGRKASAGPKRPMRERSEQYP